MQREDRSDAKPYDFEDLKHKYWTKQITADQLCGQLLVWIQKTHGIAVNNQRRMEGQEDDIADISARVITLEEENRKNRKEGGGER